MSSHFTSSESYAECLREVYEIGKFMDFAKTYVIFIRMYKDVLLYQKKNIFLSNTSKCSDHKICAADVEI